MISGITYYKYNNIYYDQNNYILVLFIKLLSNIQSYDYEVKICSSWLNLLRIVNAENNLLLFKNKNFCKTFYGLRLSNPEINCPMPVTETQKTLFQCIFQMTS